MTIRESTAKEAQTARVSRWKTLIIVAFGVVLLGVAGLVAGGWYYSDQLKNGALVPDHGPSEPDLNVIALEEGFITLGVTPDTDADGDWTTDGVFGLEWDGGYGQVGSILEVDERRVVREFVPVQGELKSGEMVRLDSFAFPGDPMQAHGIPFEEVTFRSQLGDFPAWFVDGDRDTWVIFVHGKGASRREVLRMLPSVAEMDFPSLVITYRNDPEAMPDGFYGYGQTEWKDLEAAADYAVRHGANELILVGYSMGGSIVTNFLYESPLADRVAGAVLDSPMLDFGATIDLGARQQGAPGFLTAIGKHVASFRFDIDWGDLNYMSRADELDVPLLLFHGDEDDRVPVETSDALAEARPDIVTYERLQGAGHVRSWNVDQGGYEAAVGGFLTRVAR